MLRRSEWSTIVVHLQWSLACFTNPTLILETPHFLILLSVIVFPDYTRSPCWCVPDGALGLLHRTSHYSKSWLGITVILIRSVISDQKGRVYSASLASAFGCDSTHKSLAYPSYEVSMTPLDNARVSYVKSLKLSDSSLTPAFSLCHSCPPSTRPRPSLCPFPHPPWPSALSSPSTSSPPPPSPKLQSAYR